MEWISIKNSNKIPNKECLAVNKDGNMMIGYVGFFDIEGTKAGCANYDRTMHDVTHFMILPDPPNNRKTMYSETEVREALKRLMRDVNMLNQDQIARIMVLSKESFV